MTKTKILAVSTLAAILLICYAAFSVANQGEEKEWINPFPTNPGVATYKADGTQTDVFNVGEQVNITAYSASTPYDIEVKTPGGTTIYTDTSNTARYSKLVSGITTTLGGEFEVSAGSSSTHYAVAWYTVIPEVGVAAVLTACLAGLGIHRIRKKVAQA